MTYVVYHKETTRYLPGKYQFETERAAKAAITRAHNKGKINREDYTFAEYCHFVDNIEKTVTVTNLMSGNPVEQRVNTPHCCDVSSETYWSM